MFVTFFGWNIGAVCFSAGDYFESTAPSLSSVLKHTDVLHDEFGIVGYVRCFFVVGPERSIREVPSYAAAAEAPIEALVQPRRSYRTPFYELLHNKQTIWGRHLFAISEYRPSFRPARHCQVFNYYGIMC